jgi:large subunit ribosomal protein L25
MKTVSMSGSLRENVGKKDAKKLRAQDLIPSVLYGGKEQLHFTLKELELLKIVETNEVCFLDLTIGDKKYPAILQDIQYHPVTDKPLHVDFLEIVEGKEIKMEIPVKLTGASVGVLKGGRLLKRLRKLVLKALPENMPENITIDISKLDIMDVVKVQDIEIEKVKILSVPSELIVGVKTARSIIEEEEEEEGEETEGEAKEGGEASTESSEGKEKE